MCTELSKTDKKKQPIFSTVRFKLNHWHTIKYKTMRIINDKQEMKKIKIK